MCRCLQGSHFHNSIDYHGVCIFNRVTKMGLHFSFSDFWERQFFIFTVIKCTRMFVLKVKSKVLFIQKLHYINRN